MRRPFAPLRPLRHARGHAADVSSNSSSRSPSSRPRSTSCKFVSSDAEVNIGEEIARLRAKSRALTTSIFANLSPWQVAQLARHPQRPYTLDYAAAIFEEFHELHGDRMYADDQAIVGGLARLDGRAGRC